MSQAQFKLAADSEDGEQPSYLFVVPAMYVSQENRGRRWLSYLGGSFSLYLILQSICKMNRCGLNSVPPKRYIEVLTSEATEAEIGVMWLWAEESEEWVASTRN